MLLSCLLSSFSWNQVPGGRVINPITGKAGGQSSAAGETLGGRLVQHSCSTWVHCEGFIHIIIASYRFCLKALFPHYRMHSMPPDVHQRMTLQVLALEGKPTGSSS